MKKTIAILLVLCLCAGLCACGGNSEPTTELEEYATPTEPQIVTDEQAEMARRSAAAHAFIDYGYSLDSITYKSCTDDGTYVTVNGIVTFIDDYNVKYSGEYTVVLTEQDDDPQYPYKVVLWELPVLKADIDPNRDYLAELCNYVVKTGFYDKEDNRSYIEEQIVSNEYYYLFAKNGEISFWDIASNETNNSKFLYSFTCDFKKGEANQFELIYSKFKMSGGYATDGFSVRISGTISKGKVTITSDNSVNCNANDYKNDLLDSYEDYIAFIESIMRKASIPITLEQMLA